MSTPWSRCDGEQNIFHGCEIPPIYSCNKKSNNYSCYGSFTLGNNANIGSTENFGLQTIAAVWQRNLTKGIALGCPNLCIRSDFEWDYTSTFRHILCRQLKSFLTCITLALMPMLIGPLVASQAAIFSSSSLIAMELLMYTAGLALMLHLSSTPSYG